MTEPKWYVARGGVAVGPCTRAELAQMAATGLLARTDLVRMEGGAVWSPAASVPGVFTTPRRCPRCLRLRGPAA